MNHTLKTRTYKSGKTEIGVYLNDRKIGRILFADLDSPGFYICQLYVHDKHMNKGLGTILLNAAIDTAYNKGCTGVSLHVDITNERAIRLYKRLGFFICCITNKKPRHYIMAKNLNIET